MSALLCRREILLNLGLISCYHLTLFRYLFYLSVSVVVRITSLHQLAKLVIFPIYQQVTAIGRFIPIWYTLSPIRHELKCLLCMIPKLVNILIYDVFFTAITHSSTRSFKPQLEDIKSSYLLISKKPPETPKPVVENGNGLLFSFLVRGADACRCDFIRLSNTLNNEY